MPTILVVDDRPDAVQLLCDLLEMEGYDTAAAYDGHQALDSLRRRLPDLVLLDINMPNLNGYEVCQRMKADPKMAAVPVLMLTAWAEPDQRIKGLQMGAEDYLAKPFDHRELLARIETRLRAKQQADRLRTTQQTIRATFERFVPAHVVQRLLDDPSQVSLGGTEQMVTILFADLRGYTALAETLEPETLVGILNGHLTVAAQAVLAQEGTISHYSGDLVMAIFNAPLMQPDHAARAARAAVLLMEEMANYHDSLPPELCMGCGIGIASGNAIVGNIGTKELFNFTAVGDTVNLAQRLEDIAAPGEILLTESTNQLLPSVGFQTELRGRIALRGRSEPATVYTLLGLDSEKTE
jgi:class 3 adenylate cyclase